VPQVREGSPRPLRALKVRPLREPTAPQPWELREPWLER
jgi:hypothetical protein